MAKIDHPNIVKAGFPDACACCAVNMMITETKQMC